METGGCHEAQPGEIYPYGYDPTFYPHRLQQPTEKKHPPGIKVFVVDVGDLFGDWIPDDWINPVLDKVRECERLHYKYIFHFLTKNPIKYHDFPLPDNVWIGTSIDDNATAVKRYNDLIGYNKSNVNRFISFEPLLQNINMNSITLEKIDWVMIGADSRYNAKKPPRRYADNIIDIARNLKIPVFIKENYSNYPKEERVKEFPSRGNGVKTMHISKFDSRYRNKIEFGDEYYKRSLNNAKKDIKGRGFDGITPIDVWGKIVVGGYARIEAAYKLGFKELPVKEHPFESEEEYFKFIRANKPLHVKLKF